MDVLADIPALRRWVASKQGRRIGFVPTMGYLHHGHASLIDLLRPDCDALVVSSYVNPKQFGPTEDLDRYPSDPEGDEALVRKHGADALFRPTSLYPSTFATNVHVSGLTDGLCGASRPGHFDGVATVVARLFGLVSCDVAIFGEKDWQQLAVVRRLVDDLALPVQIVGAPIVREADGLAASSRNVYLDASARRRAVTLSRALGAMAEAARCGERRVEVLRAAALDVLDVDRLDYLEVVDADTLSPLQQVRGPARALVAAFFGKTRLIDNVGLE